GGRVGDVVVDDGQPEPTQDGEEEKQAVPDDGWDEPDRGEPELRPTDGLACGREETPGHDRGGPRRADVGGHRFLPSLPGRPTALVGGRAGRAATPSSGRRGTACTAAREGLGGSWPPARS